MSLQVRIRRFDGTDAVILDKAREKSLFKTLNSSDEGVRFVIAKNDTKAVDLNPDVDGYKFFWEVWDTKKNIRRNFGPITNITESGTDWKVEGSGRSALLEDFSGSTKTFYSSILRLIEDFRLENLAIEPRTTTVVHDTEDTPENATVFGDVTVNEKYHGISKGSKDNAIDDDKGIIRPGEIEPPNTYYTTESFWAGMSKADTLIVDLGDNYDITKFSLLFPWWGGVQRFNNRTFDYTLDYATDDETPLTTVQNREFGPFHQLYDSGNGNRRTGRIFDYIAGTDAVDTVVDSTSTFFVAQDQAGPIIARYIRIKIRNVNAYFGSTLDDDPAQNLWDYQCDPNYGGSKPKPPMIGKTISETVVGPANDCYASIVEVGAHKPIVDRDVVKELALQRVDNNNLQLTYFHTPTAAETITTSNGYRKFEPGSFFRRYTVQYSGATGGPYTKFYDSDCSNCYPDPFRFGIVDQNNSLVLARDETSGTFSRRIGNETKHLLMKGASNATITYCDAWPANTDVFSWGGSYSYTRVAGDYVVAHFRGQSFRWYATIPEGETGAQVSVEIRQKLPDNTWSAYSTLVANLQLPTNVYAYPVYAITYESGILEYNTTYEIKITNLDGGFASVDSIEGYWEGSFTQYNEDSTRISVNFPNALQQIYDKRFSGGSLFKFNKHLTHVNFGFEGDRVIVYSARGRNHGQLTFQLFNVDNGGFYDPGAELDTVVNIPGGDPVNGSLTIDLDTGKRGNEFAQAIVFDSNDYFPNGLPWGHYYIDAKLFFVEEYTARNADITSTSFMERCKDCKPDTGETSVINKYVYIDGIAAHEKVGLSVTFDNQTNLERLKSVVEVIQGEWDVNDVGLAVEPRIGQDTYILLREGTNTLVDWEIVNDVTEVATMLVASGADIDGLPLFTITEDKKNKDFIGRTIMRQKDFREVADYETLIGLSRGELRKRKKPQKRITVTHVSKTYLDLEVGDTFLLFTKKMGRIRVRINRKEITESNGFLNNLECVVWDRDDEVFFIQLAPIVFVEDPSPPDPNTPPDPEPPPPVIPPTPTPPPPPPDGGDDGNTGGGGTGGGGDGGGSGGSSGTGNSITINANTSELYSAMANANLDEIIIRDGSMGHIDITSARISRTASKPLYIRAQNRWGVKISGWSGEGISINNGASYFTLDGFEFQNADAEQGGCIVLGSEGNQSWVGCHHIDLLNMKIGSTVTGPGSAGSTANSTAHGLYIGAAAGGGHHHIVADGWVVQNNFAGLAAAFHMYHSSSGRPNGHDIVFKNAVIDRVTQAIIIWDGTIYNTTVGPNVRITNCNPTAVRHEYGSVVLDDVRSTGSGSEPLVNHGSGMTINPNCSFA